MTTFAKQVEALLAVTGEWTDDDELIAATRKLSHLAVEADDIERRFRAAMMDVEQLLELRM